MAEAALCDAGGDHERAVSLLAEGARRNDVDAMTEMFRASILPELEQTPGFCSGSLLVNRSSGLGCATTAWESREAMEASDPMPTLNPCDGAAPLHV